MQDTQKPRTRKKFLLLTAAALCSATILKFFKGSPKKSKYTVKMLTQDGRLVEIDQELLHSQRKRISNEELQQWVKTKPTQH